MKTSLRLAGATALCAALLLTACAKKAEQTTTSTQAAADAGVSSAPAATASGSPDAAVSATPVAIVSASPDATASGTANAATSVPSISVTTKSSNGAASGGFIDLPIYPGAAESKEGAMSMSTNTGSFTVKIYTSKDDTKKVAEWYKSRLPGSFKGGILTAGDKTVGTFTDEHGDGDQSVIVAAADDHTTRIQLSTKHGK
ncbi:MAG: hypothetical protein QOJ39_666 [Candidatus Eremiobacteraeota bacterium]|jgi:hypothetical protein|nr:hypothetical protein [Candidatus Eremiobacteraeota bacterium]MEA2718802.1 hypothetical protein [Candidatus Eremiobacteraeota bacterium]